MKGVTILAITNQITVDLSELWLGFRVNVSEILPSPSHKTRNTYKTRKLASLIIGDFVASLLIGNFLSQGLLSVASLMSRRMSYNFGALRVL